MKVQVLSNKADPSGVHYSLGSDVYCAIDVVVVVLLLLVSLTFFLKKIIAFGVIMWEMITLCLPWGEIPFDFQIEDHVTSGEQLLVCCVVFVGQRESKN